MSHEETVAAKRVMVTRREGAYMFSVHPGHLANLASKGQGPRMYKHGSKKCLYDVNDLQEYFHSNPIETVDSVRGRG